MATRELNPNPLKPRPSACSFCGQPEDEVKVLIHSNGNYICDCCVDDINELLKEDEEKGPA